MVPASTLPPQAYTRDILAKAYLWMQTQSESIRKMAITPDALVGLYLRSQRNNESFESVGPVTRDHFISDLKNLASELEQFEMPTAQTKSKVTEGFIKPEPSNKPAENSRSQQSNHDDAIHFLKNSLLESNLHDNQGVAPATNQEPNELIKPSPILETGFLDPKTRVLIQDVKNRLNLSSDIEALRMLVTLGYEKAKNLF